MSLEAALIGILGETIIIGSILFVVFYTTKKPSHKMPPVSHRIRKN